MRTRTRDDSSLEVLLMDHVETTRKELGSANRVVVEFAEDNNIDKLIYDYGLLNIVIGVSNH